MGAIEELKSKTLAGEKVLLDQKILVSVGSKTASSEVQDLVGEGKDELFKVLTGLSICFFKEKSVSEFSYRSLIAVASSSNDELVLSFSNQEKISSNELSKAASLIQDPSTQVFYCSGLSGFDSQVLAHIQGGLIRGAPGCRGISKLVDVSGIPEKRLLEALDKHYKPLVASVNWKPASSSSTSSSLSNDVDTVDKYFSQMIETVVRVCQELEGKPMLGICDGYLHSYRAACKWLQTPVNDALFERLKITLQGLAPTELNLAEISSNLSEKDIQALIEALHYNTWFKSVTISYQGKETSFSQSTLKSLLLLFKRNASLEQVFLEGDFFGPTVRKDFFNALADVFVNKAAILGSLKSFSISDCQIEDKFLTSFASSVAGKNSLTSLTLNSCSISGKSISLVKDSLKSIIASGLTKLDLSNNKLGEEGATALIGILGQPNKLKSLRLNSCSIPLEGLIGALGKGCNENLLHLELSSNSLSDTKKVDFNFFEVCKSASTISLDSISGLNNKNNLSGLLHALSNNISFQKASLSISLRNNNLGAGECEAFESLLPKILCVESLNLSGNNLSDGLANILAGVSGNATLNELILSNCIGGKSVAKLNSVCSILKGRKLPIVRLSLAYSGATQSDLVAIVDAVATNTRIQSLDLSGNKLGDKGVVSISNLLNLNTSISELNINDIGITSSKSFIQILNSLKRNLTIESLELQHDYVSVMRADDSILQKIRKIIKRNKDAQLVNAGIIQNLFKQAIEKSIQYHRLREDLINNSASSANSSEVTNFLSRTQNVSQKIDRFMSEVKGAQVRELFSFKEQCYNLIGQDLNAPVLGRMVNRANELLSSLGITLMEPSSELGMEKVDKDTLEAISHYAEMDYRIFACYSALQTCVKIWDRFTRELDKLGVNMKPVASNANLAAASTSEVSSRIDLNKKGGDAGSRTDLSIAASLAALPPSIALSKNNLAQPENESVKRKSFDKGGSKEPALPPAIAPKTSSAPPNAVEEKKKTVQPATVAPHEKAKEPVAATLAAEKAMSSSSSSVDLNALGDSTPLQSNTRNRAGKPSKRPPSRNIVLENVADLSFNEEAPDPAILGALLSAVKSSAPAPQSNRVSIFPPGAVPILPVGGVQLRKTSKPPPVEKKQDSPSSPSNNNDLSNNKSPSESGSGNPFRKTFAGAGRIPSPFSSSPKSATDEAVTPINHAGENSPKSLQSPLKSNDKLNNSTTTNTSSSFNAPPNTSAPKPKFPVPGTSTDSTKQPALPPKPSNGSMSSSELNKPGLPPKPTASGGPKSPENNATKAASTTTLSKAAEAPVLRNESSTDEISKKLNARKAIQSEVLPSSSGLPNFSLAKAANANQNFDSNNSNSSAGAGKFNDSSTKEVFDKAAEWLRANSEGGNALVSKDTVIDYINDGVAFIKALEKATKTTSPSKYHAKAFLPVHRIDNLNVAVSILTKAGVNPGVTAQEIHDKDVKKTAVLFQAILAKYPVAK